ncbi:MAG: BrnT family toxin [Phycisphaerae bacterium]|nr:BrnT family toxin [Phycisphaerae bacterium]
MKELFADIVGFDWDDGNRDKNNLNHNVLNGECEDVFFNQPLIIAGDTMHSKKEKRYAAFGVTDGGRKLTIIFTLRAKLIRVISARDMNGKERKYYEEHA